MSKKEYIKQLKKEDIFKPLKKLAKIAKLKLVDCIEKDQKNNKYNWLYNKYEWTKEEEIKYKKWFKKYIKRKYKYLSERKITYEIAMFLLCYGWKNQK